MTVLTRTITLVTIYDGADFNRRLDRRAFEDQDDATAWGQARVADLQLQRREEGETDEAFIEAIERKEDYITYQLA